MFIASGKSDMMVLDISNPAQPDSCNFFGGVNNDIGTWGIGLFKNQIYLSYICVPLWPFPSNWTGVKILSYNSCSTTAVKNENDLDLKIYPNPTSQDIKIQWTNCFDHCELSIFNSLGVLIKRYSNIQNTSITFNTEAYTNGVYSILLKQREREIIKKFIIEKFIIEK